MRLLAGLLRWSYIVCGIGAIAIGAILLADGSATALAVILIVFGAGNMLAGVMGWGLGAITRAQAGSRPRRPRS